MSTPDIGEFDHVVAMDSLIHYQLDDVIQVLGEMTAKTRHSVVFTFAPRTLLLDTMWAVGKLFPKSDRSPAIVPVAESKLRNRLENDFATGGWQSGRSLRVNRGFYISQAFELNRQ